ncbi:MAG: FADH(2)-oxidizing methylenetetrahydrofolate--tRNA-(uracil(54)-C(5))-methyltransferase TrmFO [Chloroflexia bacterium]|nr:FADH(2)-oxidizing methylenetetrahydrofolate--tRNA-(uracil(54)-C(5))-methyltransferase TrmFO [Chloroflexia bacterium]
MDKPSEEQLDVIGGGLAGSEAAWQAAERGLQVRLYEMRPRQMTPAHQSEYLAELVCSNSLGARQLDRALGLLKQELRRLGSMLLECAQETALPAGGALAVGRTAFARAVTARIQAHPRITVVREEIDRLPGGPAIVATGPLTSPALAQEIASWAGQEHLYFYDAMAPIVTAESVDMEVAFRASRYGRGGDDYINCPLDEQAYDRFVQALLSAETAPRREFEDPCFFEACLPVEEIARRGPQSLAYGPLRPVGLTDPRTGRRPYAVVQLRQDDLAGRLYNLVGFQTNLRWPDQRRVFRLIPGLEQAEFVRLGQMHRNTFLHSPALLQPSMQSRARQDLFFAGQLIGSEGYVGSIATGLLAGINAAGLLQGRPLCVLPQTTMLGALAAYLSGGDPRREFQPMKANFGLLPPLEPPVRGKRERYAAYARRALEALETFLQRERSQEAEDGRRD